MIRSLEFYSSWDHASGQHNRVKLRIAAQQEIGGDSCPELDVHPCQLQLPRKVPQRLVEFLFAGYDLRHVELFTTDKKREKNTTKTNEIMKEKEN